MVSPSEPRFHYAVEKWYDQKILMFKEKFCWFCYLMKSTEFSFNFDETLAYSTSMNVFLHNIKQIDQ